MLATIVVLRTGKALGVISFPGVDLSIPGKVRLWRDICDDKKILVLKISSFNISRVCVFPDVSTASAVCRESNIRALWDTTTQVRVIC